MLLINSTASIGSLEHWKNLQICENKRWVLNLHVKGWKISPGYQYSIKEQHHPYLEERSTVSVPMCENM